MGVKYANISDKKFGQLVRSLVLDLETSSMSKIFGLIRNTINWCLSDMRGCIVEFCEFKLLWMCDFSLLCAE